MQGRAVPRALESSSTPFLNPFSPIFSLGSSSLSSFAYYRKFQCLSQSLQLFITGVACERRAAEGRHHWPRSTEHWFWVGGRRPALLMLLDKFLHLSFEAPWLRLILPSNRFLHQLIARGFQMTLLNQDNPRPVLLGPAFGGP